MAATRKRKHKAKAKATKKPAPRKKPASKSPPKSKKRKPSGSRPERARTSGVATTKSKARARAPGLSERGGDRARRKRSRKAIERERKTKARSKAAKKAAATRKRNRERADKLAQSEQRAAERGKLGIYKHLERALLTMAESSPYPLAVSIEAAPESERTTPWLIAADFTPDGEPLTYDHWMRIFSAWENDLILEASINPSRVARVFWMYQRHDEDGEPFGGEQGFSPGGAGAWSRVIAEARQWCDPDVNESPSREPNTLVTRVTIQLSGELYTGRVLRL